MRQFFTSNFSKTSSIYSRLTEAEKYHRNSHPWILESYHYIGKQSYVEKIRAEGQKVFLDSGAFSMFTKGVEIDIPAYCDYVKANWDIIVEDDRQLLFSVLDKISFTDKVESAAGTRRNQQTMEDYFNRIGCPGVRPLPCFHYGEDPSNLMYYAANYPYITIGGMVPISTRDLKIWLDGIWSKYLVDGSGRPKCKVHGFGLTTVELMERYPWYSVDSSSWVQIAVHGNILLPEKGQTIAISTDSPRIKEANQHFETFAPPMRAAIRKKAEEQGFDVERLKASAYSRWAFNFWAFKVINDRTNRANKTFKPHDPGPSDNGPGFQVGFF